MTIQYKSSFSFSHRLSRSSSTSSIRIEDSIRMVNSFIDRDMVPRFWPLQHFSLAIAIEIQNLYVYMRLCHSTNIHTHTHTCTRLLYFFTHPLILLPSAFISHRYKKNPFFFYQQQEQNNKEPMKIICMCKCVVALYSLYGISS